MATVPNLATDDIIDETWTDSVTNAINDSRGVVLTDSGQTITSATVTDITWGTEVKDPDGWTSGGSATLTVPTGKGGRYIITYQGYYNGTVGTQSAVTCVYNATATYEAVTAGGAWFAPTLTFVRTLAAGDTLKFAVYHSAGANRDITSRLEIAWLADS